MSHRPARRRTLRLPSTLALLASLTAALLLPTAAGAVVAAAPSKQELVVNIGTYPTTLDPAKAATSADLAVQNALFAPLYRSPGGATGTLVPFLAAGQPVVTDGGRTWTVRLRAGAVWSDGTPITATDVRVAFDRARGVNVLGPMFEQVRSATVVDARTIRFTLAQPVVCF